MWKNLRLYLILVMIPAFIISFFVYEQERENITEKHRQTATLMLNIHRNQINYLIGETEARMSSMATALNHPIDQKQMKRILTETYKKNRAFRLCICSIKTAMSRSAQRLSKKKASPL